MPDLTSYIKRQLKRGHNINEIKQFLYSRGYDPRSIEKSMQEIQETTIKHEIHFSKTAILSIILIIAGLGLAAFSIFYFFPSQEALLDLETNLITQSVKPGEDLKFTLELSNLGSKQRFDITLRHNIATPDNELLTFKEETIAIETRTSTQAEIKIPQSTEPGIYTLRTTARYDGKIATAALSFRIVQEQIIEEETEEIQEQEIIEIQSCPSCNDNNACTRDICSEETNFECRFEQITPCCGNSICEPTESFETCSLDCTEPIGEANLKDLEPWEKVEAVKQLTGDPETAGELCSTIQETYYSDQCFYILGTSTTFLGNCDSIEGDRLKDDCYIDVAIQNRNTEICSQLQKESRRDACYTEFFKELKDYSVCDNIVNDYLRDSCNALKTIPQTA